MPFRRELVKAIAKEVKNELRDYSKGSSCARYNGDPLSLEKFNHEELLEEAGKRMPITHSIVTVASKSSKYLLNKQALVLSAMLSTWLPRSNFIYRLNTVLTAGCCKTEVMDLFHRLGLCSHPNTIRAQLQSSADHFDSEIVMWKKKIENNRKQIKLLEEVVSCQTDSPDPDSMELCSVDFSRETIEKYKYFNEEIYKLCQTSLPDQGIEDRDVEMAIKTLKEEKLPKYRIVGDNIDLEQSARYQSNKNNNKSLHWFQIYGVRDRVFADACLSEDPQKSLKDLEMKEFLPTADVHSSLVKDLTLLLPRILVKYLPAYQPFKNSVVVHIPHPHSDDIVRQSEVCSLGLEFYNSNKAAEMAKILSNVHEKFVPMTELRCGNKEILERVVFDGDQLTEERARNAQIANVLSDTPHECLSGLETSFADWHLGMNLLEIFFKLFVKEDSASTIGTSYASMNRTGKINAKKGPEKDYNAYKEFIDRETEAHIVSKWMTFTGINSFEDLPKKRPIPKEAESWSPHQKSAWLYEEVKEFLSTALLPAGNLAERVDRLDTAHREGFRCRSPECPAMFPLHSSRVRHEVSRHPGLNLEIDGDHDRDSLGYYKCRNNDCPLVFTTSTTRMRHERVQHKTECKPPETPPDKHKCKEDGIFNYHNARLQCGLIFLNMTDTIKEGDGERLVRCYKIILLFDYKFKHTKYAYALLLFFAKIYALLSEKEAHLLVNNRFVNTKGIKGGNIPLDLHMEHLNLDVKKLLKAMGGKITHAAAQRCARSMTVMNKVMDTVYEECDKSHQHGYHGNKTNQETIQSIATDLTQGKVFEYTPGREGYPSFPNFKSNILEIDYRDFFKWVRNHLKEWQGIYEIPNNQ